MTARPVSTNSPILAPNRPQHPQSPGFGLVDETDFQRRVELEGIVNAIVYAAIYTPADSRRRDLLRAREYRIKAVECHAKARGLASKADDYNRLAATIESPPA